MRTLLILILAGFIISCTATAGYEQTVSSWRGANTRTLFKAWGNPYFTNLTDKQRKLYVYSINSLATVPPTSYHSVPTIVNANGRPLLVNVPVADAQARKIKCFVSFIANQQDIIISTTIHGNNCAPVPSPP